MSDVWSLIEQKVKSTNVIQIPTGFLWSSAWLENTINPSDSPEHQVLRVKCRI